MPGHADFVKNMVAGTGGVDVGLVVVAADDGWMPQTEELFQILTYLGVKRLIVAVNKSDLDRDLTALTAEQAGEQLAGTAYADAPILLTSALHREGLNSLRAALVETLEGLPEPDDFGRARFYLDRVFTIPGQGRVVTGTLQGGTLQEGAIIAVVSLQGNPACSFSAKSQPETFASRPWHTGGNQPGGGPWKQTLPG